MNERDILAAADNWARTYGWQKPEGIKGRVRRMMAYSREPKRRLEDVPDPYYGALQCNEAHVANPTD